jgi:hypothetical protein
MTKIEQREKYKFFKIAHMRDLENQVARAEISYSRMVEIINDMAYEFYVKSLDISSSETIKI